MFRKLFSTIWMLASIAAIAMGLSAYASFVTGQWQWLGRSGSIVTICGVMLGIRPAIRTGFVEWVTAERIIDGGNFSPSPEEIEADRQQRIDLVASIFGPIIAIVGTLVWAYGDLLGRVFGA